MSNSPYFVGSNTAASGGLYVLTVAVTNSVASGDSIVIGILANVSGANPTVTDSQGNTYVKTVGQTGQATAQTWVYEADGCNALTAGTDDIYVTYAVNTGVQGAIVFGDNNVTGLDKTNNGSASSTAVTTNATGTLSQAEEHVFVFGVDTAAGGAITWASPFATHNVAVEAASTTRLCGSYTTVTATTSLTGTATITSAAHSAVIMSTLVAPPTISTVLSGGVEGEAYSQTLAATGGNNAYTWSITDGSLPTGLSLSTNVISGTPEESGDFTITIQVDDGYSLAGTTTQTIRIWPSSLPTAADSPLDGNILTRDDSDFNSSDTGTWAALTNAEDLAYTTSLSVTGGGCLSWTATAAGTTEVETGYYSVEPSKPYIVSGYLLSPSITYLYIGIAWYDDTDTLIETDFGNFSASVNIGWQPVSAALTSPSNAAHAKIVAQVASANASDIQYGDLFYLAQTDAQVLIDWENGTNGTGSQAGNDFMDVSPWVRMDQQGISLARGRQDSISEIQAGSGSFNLQNDLGYFTRFKSTSLVSVVGGDATLQRRCQINFADETGVWHTRADGPISQLSYTFDNTGNTNLLAVNTTDVLAPLNREETLSCWTREQVLSNGPLLHYALNDTGTSNGTGIAAETSGNNGPPLRLRNTDGSNVATISWNSSSGGVETLADAVFPAAADGSEYWSAGNVVPNSFVRGLDAGVVGPVSTPLPNVTFVPVLSTETNANQFVGNVGYSLRTQLPHAAVNKYLVDGAQVDVIAPIATGDDYTAECWFTMDPTIASHNSASYNYGPFVIMCLSDSTTGVCLMGAIELSDTAGTMYMKLLLYAQPPSFSGSNFSANTAPSPTHTISLTFTPDATDPMPHHLVITIQGDPAAPIANAYLDNTQIQTGFTLGLGQTFDTLTLGAESGGKGCHYGAISCFSIYNYMLTSGQITQDCRMGQYGMWEATTDDCVARLATYAGIPAFWNNTAEQDLGLSLTEYYDITGSNALSAMEQFEQAEQGLLFVDASGLLQFHTRDWRMGYGAPDLYLPPDTFDASMGYEIIDQFMVNEQGVSSAVFTTGTGYVNLASQDEYGTYATSTATSPVELPLVSWSRAYAQLGLAPFVFWTTPNMDDFAAFSANAKGDPWVIPGQLTIDMKTLSKDSTGVGISDLYALEIDNMIAPSGTMPGSWPDENLSVEWFIEGINETKTNTSWNIQFYTSPAESQRCWIPGDDTYGVLGTNTRLGVSAADLSLPPAADGKDVQHDGGGPYTVPYFTTTGLNNPAGNGHSFIGANDIRGLTDNMHRMISPPMWCVGATATSQSVGSGQFVNTHVYWDNIYVDTEGGMGLIPAWPNWYCVTVPGYYDLDGVASSEAQAVTGKANQGLFLVAKACAQNVAAGNGKTPTSNGAYVCPIGSQIPSYNSTGAYPQSTVSTRMYLGVGDMIALAYAQTTGNTYGLSTKWGGSMFSGVWRGFASVDDRVNLNSTTAGGTVTPAPGVTTYVTKSYTNSATYAYYGAQGSYDRRNTNGNVYQGDPQSGIGSESSQVAFSAGTRGQMASDASGNTIESVTMTCHNLHTWYGSGGNLLLGWGVNQEGFGGANPATNGGTQAVSTIPFAEGQTKTFSLPVSFVNALISGDFTYIQVGQADNDNLNDYGYWAGGPNSWTITVTYKVVG